MFVKKFFQKKWILFWIVWPVVCQGSLRITLPDTTVIQHASFALPLIVDGIEADDSIVAYQLEFSYDPSFLSLEAIETEGTFIQHWDEPVVNTTGGVCRIAGYSANGSGQKGDTGNHTFLFLQFQNLVEAEATTELNLTEFRLFNLTDQLPNGQIHGSYIQLIINYPPVFSDPLDIEVDEDSTVTIDMNNYVQDPNGDETRLEFVPSQHIGIEWNASAFKLLIRPEADYDSTASIVVTAIDPYQQSAQDTLRIAVLPKPDAPLPFSLISPENNALLEENTDTLYFSWQLPVDVDRNDYLEYTFYLSSVLTFSGDDLVQHSQITSNQILVTDPLQNNINYYWIVRARDTQNNSVWSNVHRFSLGAVSAITEKNQAPDHFHLYPNFPNPFNPCTAIQFEIPVNSCVEMNIFDIRGNRVRTLINSYLREGMHTVLWDGRNNNGDVVSSGLYIYRLETENYRAQRPMVYIH